MDQLVYIKENLNKVKLEHYDYGLVPASAEEEAAAEDPANQADVIEEPGPSAGPSTRPDDDWRWLKRLIDFKALTTYHF